MKKILTVFLCTLCLFGCTKKQESAQTKNINVQVIDEINDKELFNGTLTGGGETLADMLESAQSVLDVVMEDSEYGKYITAILGVEQTNTNFWVYDSDNNKSCLDAGMCMGVSETNVEDGDNFVFKYTDTFE